MHRTLPNLHENIEISMEKVPFGLVVALLGEELVSLAGLLTLEIVVSDGLDVDLGGIDLQKFPTR